MRILCAVVLAVLAVAAPVQAQTRIAVIVVDFPTSDPAPVQTMERTREDMAHVDAFYLEQSYQQFHLQSDVFGIYTVPLGLTATRLDIADAAQRAASDAGVDLAVYDGFVYVSPLTDYVRAGWGDRTGVWIARLPWYPAPPGVDTAVHELGHHLFGLLHAHGQVCSDGTPLGGSGATCLFTDQGDTLDAMGVGHGHFSAITKAALGWLTPDGNHQIQIVTQDGEYLIAPFEALGGVKALRVSGSGKYATRTYVLEYRQPIGYDTSQPWADPANVFKGVTVHLMLNGTTLLKMAPSADADIDTPALTVGQRYCDRHAKVEMTTLAADTAGALVRVRRGACR